MKASLQRITRFLRSPKTGDPTGHWLWQVFCYL